MQEQIENDDDIKPAGRWATATCIFGVFGLLMGAAFAKPFSVHLGVPTLVSYGLAGLGGVTMVLFNLGIGSLSKATINMLITVFLVILMIMTAMGCALAYVDGGFSGQSLGSMGIFAGIFVLTAMLAWRLKVLVGRM